MASSKTTNADLQVEVVKMKTGDPNPVSEWMDFGQEKVVEACVKDLKSAGWILLRGGMKGNPPAQAAPAAPERRVGEGNVVSIYVQRLPSIVSNNDPVRRKDLREVLPVWWLYTGVVVDKQG